MLFRSVYVLSLAGSVTFASGLANYPRGAMWIFGNHGLSIYSTDGSKVLKSMPPEDFCPIDEAGTPVCRSYHEIVSDYGKYAWTTANSRGSTNVEIFDLDNGDHVGSFPTCTGPRGFHFLPSRKEIWFRCTAPHTGDPDGESGYWDSFSTTSISLHFPEISLKRSLPHSDETSYGQPVFLEERGIGYSSDFSAGVVHKVDLDARVPLSNITIPDTSGTWDITYSPSNEHIFVKTHVCCTCGGPDKDLENCVEYRGGVHADPVFVVTGPSADPSQTQIGACGRFCENSKADVIGVAEIDTRTDTVVGYHQNSIGLGASAVHLSPNGEYVVLVSTVGAPANVRLIKPGANGQVSALFKDISIPTEGRLGDHAFVTSDILAITSSDDRNQLFFIQISAGTIYTIPLDLSATANTDNGSGRMMRYIPGSKYLWLSANGPESDADKFAYVVELNFEDWASSKVVRKVTGIDVNGMFFVENMKLAREHEISRRNNYGVHVNATISRVDALEQELKSLRSELRTTSTTRGVQSSDNGKVSSSSSRTEETNEALSITALVLGAFAVILSIVGLARNKNGKPVSTVTGGSSTRDGIAQHPSNDNSKEKEDLEENASDFGGSGSVDNYSMGSKRDQFA